MIFNPFFPQGSEEKSIFCKQQWWCMKQCCIVSSRTFNFRLLVRTLHNLLLLFAKSDNTSIESQKGKRKKYYCYVVPVGCPRHNFTWHFYGLTQISGLQVWHTKPPPDISVAILLFHYLAAFFLTAL